MSDAPDLPPLGDIETPDGIFNAANRGGVKAREKAVKLREEGKDEALRVLISTKYGRAVVYDLLHAAGFWNAGVSATYNSNEMWARAGARQVAMALHEAAWRADLSAYKLMIEENANPP